MKYGVLGLGSIGTRHAGNLCALKKDVLVFDPSPERLQWASDNGFAVSDSRNEVIDKSGSLIIASPNHQHLSDLSDGIAADCHCLVEKPISHTLQGLNDVLDQATAAGLVVFAALNLRFHPAVLAAKKLLEQGAIGTPLWANLISSHFLPGWRPHQDYRQGYTADISTGGVIFDIIHEFDLAHFLLGPGKTIAAAARNTGAIDIASEDCADIIVAHASGVHSNIHLDYITRPTQRMTRVGGIDGILEVDIVKRCVGVLDATGEQVAHQDFSFSASSDDYVDEMRAFVKSVEEGFPSPCSGYDGLDVLQQVVAARRICGLPET